MFDRALFRFGLMVAGAVLVLDQVTKMIFLYVFDTMGAPLISVLPGFFDLAIVWNRGVSFGMLATDGALGQWLLGAFALAVTVGLVVWLWRATTRWVALALGLTIGGAIGNVIDRARYGAVFDFLDFHVGGWHWPAFNMADTAISLGVAGLVLATLLERPRTTKLDGS